MWLAVLVILLIEMSDERERCRRALAEGLADAQNRAQEAVDTAVREMRSEFWATHFATADN